MESIASECGLNARAIYHYFPSKRALFQACAEASLARFGREVMERVFVHDSLRQRIDAYIDVYRSLHADEPDILPFIGMLLTYSLSGNSLANDPGADQANVAGDALRNFLQVVVEQAIERSDVPGDTDPKGAVLLLQAMGMGLSLAAIDAGDDFGAMLDTLQRWVDGTLLG